jgi:hypothetical protein
MRLSTETDVMADEQAAIKQGELILNMFGFNPDGKESNEDPMNQLLSAIGGFQEALAHSSALVSTHTELDETLNSLVITK